jgi:hypothetical protein
MPGDAPRGGHPGCESDEKERSSGDLADGRPPEDSIGCVPAVIDEMDEGGVGSSPGSGSCCSRSFPVGVRLIPVTSSPVMRVPSRARQQGYSPGGREPGRSPVPRVVSLHLMPGRSCGSGPSIAGEASASYLNLLNREVITGSARQGIFQRLGEMSD